jgi:hypothetical protein
MNMSFVVIFVLTVNSAAPLAVACSLTAGVFDARRENTK